MTTDIVAMSAADLARRAEQERIIGRSVRTFIDVAEALCIIRDERLYRNTHGSFDDYCRGQWNMGAGHAYRMIASAAMHREIEASPQGETAVLGSEKAGRALAEVPPEQRPEVIERAATKAKSRGGDGKATITTRDVREAKEELPPPPPPSMVLDGLGLQATEPSVIKALEAEGRFTDIFQRVHALKRDVQSLAEDPDVGREIRADQITVDLRNVATAIKFAVPFTTCPYGANCKRGCKLCQGQRWITKEQHDRLPPELKGAPQ